MTVDLFGVKPKPEAPKPQRPSPAMRPWRSVLPMCRTPRGVPFIDPVRAEEMSVALTGNPSDPDAGRFLEVISHEMANGLMGLRVFTLGAPAPARVAGSSHLSCRMQQRVRDILDRGEVRGRTVKLPFSVTLAKRSPSIPLRHGHLALEQGFDLSFVSGRTLRTTYDDWPALDFAVKCGEPIPHGCALIVGDADWRSAWSHLSETPGAGLAVWPTNSTKLWVFKAASGHAFPGPFDAITLDWRTAS